METIYSETYTTYTTFFTTRDEADELLFINEKDKYGTTEFIEKTDSWDYPLEKYVATYVGENVYELKHICYKVGDNRIDAVKKFGKILFEDYSAFHDMGFSFEFVLEN